MKTSAFLLAALLSAMAAQAQDRPVDYASTESIAALTLKVDVSCILRTWRIVGVMTCPSPAGGVTTCLIVENAYPVGVLEVVRKPLTSHLVEAAAITKGLGSVPLYGTTSSHTPNSADGTGLQFAEGHVFEFVPQLVFDSGLPLAKPRGRQFAVSYLSELDGYFWRTGIAEMLLDPVAAAKKALLPSCSSVPRLGDCAWTWGSYFPRIGFTVDPSEVMAAHLQALRAGRVASGPPGRVVVGVYPFEPRTGHYLQMVRPSPRACVPIGWPVRRLVEAGALSREGAYLWIHFGVFRECKGCMPVTLTEPRVPAGP